MHQPEEPPAQPTAAQSGAHAQADECPAPPAGAPRNPQHAADAKLADALLAARADRDALLAARAERDDLRAQLALHRAELANLREMQRTPAAGRPHTRRNPSQRSPASCTKRPKERATGAGSSG